MSQVPRAWREAAERWGPLAEGQAHKYGVKNGATLLLKIASGESGFNMAAVSGAGAKGGTQFMPATRQSFIEKYGVDPWKNPDEAMHAAGLFMKTAGLAAYNPGGGRAYIDYILKQPVAASSSRRSSHPGLASAESAQPSESSLPGGLAGEAMHLGLIGTLVIGGVALIGLGATRLLGAGGKAASG